MNTLRCDCRSDERSLVLLSGDLAKDYSDLLTLGEIDYWRNYPAFGAIRVELGTGRRMTGVGELVNFLRGVLDLPRLKALRAAWVARRLPLEEQLASLIHAGPLLDLAPADSLPLLNLLQGNRLETWYQPVVLAATGAVWGYECLMRGRSPDGELIYPNAIIAWAKQENLTFMMDRICREMHLRNAAAKLADTDVHLLINFLPTAIYDPEFCLKTTIAAATKGGISPNRIIFEVVESEEIKDIPHL